MKYYNVTFKWYDTGTYCSNIAKAECAEDVKTHYAKYDSAPTITEASSRDIEAAKERGKPVITCPHIEAPAEVDEDTTHTESGTENAEKGRENMNTENTSPAAQLFPHLFAEIAKDTDAEIAARSCYVTNGYRPTWCENERKHSDRGLQQYSTPTRWAQYQSGEISREKAVELATRRALKEVEKRHTANIAKLERAAEIKTPCNLDIMVMWKKSRTWGANPTAEAMTETRRTTGTASGCGYDKESAAIADALNQNPAVLRVLYEMGEAALAQGESPASKTACTGFNWGGCIGYGAGYTVLPYFEGGVGSSCFWSIFQKAGYTYRCTASGEMYDAYSLSRAESATA